MPDDLILLILSQPEIAILVKGVILLLLTIYFIFSLIVIRQVNIMMKVVIVPISPIFRVIIILHSVLAFLVLLLAVVII